MGRCGKCFARTTGLRLARGLYPLQARQVCLKAARTRKPTNKAMPARRRVEGKPLPQISSLLKQHHHQTRYTQRGIVCEEIRWLAELLDFPSAYVPGKIELKYPTSVVPP